MAADSASGTLPEALTAADSASGTLPEALTAAVSASGTLPEMLTAAVLAGGTLPEVFTAAPGQICSRLELSHRFPGRFTAVWTLRTSSLADLQPPGAFAPAASLAGRCLEPSRRLRAGFQVQ